MDNSIKAVVVGDGGVGKTCMMISYAVDHFPREHVPTVFDNYAVTVTAAGRPYQLCLFDTAGQEEYDRLRVLSYPGTDVFLACFSLTDPASLERLADTWLPEVRHHCGDGVRVFLVGTKQDLRADPATVRALRARRTAPVTRDQGERMARRLGAHGYLECSALTRRGLTQVFNAAIMAVVQPHPPGAGQAGRGESGPGKAAGKERKAYEKTKKGIKKMLCTTCTAKY